MLGMSSSSASTDFLLRHRAILISAGPSKKQSKNIEQEPARITSNVKENLLYLKLQRGKQSGPKPSTSYRKKKVEEENLLDEAILYNDAPTKFYFTDQMLEEVRPVLLVDGYNICGYWPKLKKQFTNGKLENARHKLLEELAIFRAIKDVKVVVVFDATLSGKPNHKDIFQGIDVIFSASMSADEWIEREVTLLKKDGCPLIWVATSDSIHRQCASNVGAFVWSCKKLISQIKEAKKEQDQILLEKRSFSMQGKLLEHNMNPEVIDALKGLKKKLQQPASSMERDNPSN